MMRFKNSLLGLVVVLMLVGSCNIPAKLPQQPNIVFILIDDLGYADVGYLNHKPEVQTPNINRLAENGVVFTQAYAAAPVCSPTRASILTGKSPAVLKTTCHIPGLPMERYLKRQNTGKRLKEAFFQNHLPLSEVTIAEVLKDNGYTTGFFGKWHLAGDGSVSTQDGMIAPLFHPEHQGFDVNIGGCAYGQPKKWFAPFKNATIPDKESGEYLTDRLGEEAVNFITQNKENPFFLYLSTYTVHTPLVAPEETVEKYDGNTYFAMIEELDQNVGKVMDQLESANLLENTIVIFYSDNGGLWGNAPLKDNKGSLHEGGIRVPLIINWPSKIKAGRTENTPVTSVDFFPTLMEMASIPYRENMELEGESLMPLLLEEKEMEERPLYWHFPHHRKDGLTMAAAIREGDWKLIWAFEPDSLYLYNLKEDIAESTNLTDTYPEKSDELLSKLKAWQTRVGAEMPTVNEDFIKMGNNK